MSGDRRWMRRSIEPQCQQALQQAQDWLTPQAVIGRLTLDRISARPQLLVQRMLHDFHAKGLVERRAGLPAAAYRPQFEYRWKQS